MGTLSQREEAPFSSRPFTGVLRRKDSWSVYDNLDGEFYNELKKYNHLCEKKVGGPLFFPNDVKML